MRHAASVEDVNYQSPRGLDRALFLKLAACDGIAERRNLLLMGASGLGKSWLACPYAPALRRSRHRPRRRALR